MIRTYSWKKAYVGAIALHTIVFGIAGIIASHQPPVGGSGMITVDLGGPAGEAGGFGIKQIEGQKGNAGTNGDGSQTLAKQRDMRHETDETDLPAPKQDGENVPEPVTRAAHEPQPEEFVEEQIQTPEPLHEVGEIQVPPKVSKIDPVKPKQQPKQKEQPVQRKKTKPDVDKPVNTATPIKEKTKVPETSRSVQTQTDGLNGTAKRVNAGASGVAGAAGSASGTKAQSGSGIGDAFGDEVGRGRFVANGDGTYTATGSGGITYRIVKDANPRYPSQARTLGYNRTIRLRVRFLVGLGGNVESATVLTKKVPQLGFEEAALRAVRNMEFDPIYYKGINIKVYFVKNIIFEP